MSTAPYFEQIEQKIQILLSDKKYKEAYKLCIDFLNKFPEEKVFIKLKKKIEEEAFEKNLEIIDEKIDSIEKLWNEKKYSEILKTLQPLLKLAPDYKKLQKEISKAQELYQGQVKELQKNYLKVQREKFEKLLNEKSDWITQEFIHLERNSFEDQNLATLIAEYKEKYIQKKLHEKSELLKSDKFEAIYNLLAELKKIDPESLSLKKIEEEIKNQQHGSQIEETKEFVFSGENHLATLMKLKKYDKAIKVAEEIMETDKNNKRVAKILKEANSKFYAQSKDSVAEMITENQKNLDIEFQQNKDNFTKI